MQDKCNHKISIIIVTFNAAGTLQKAIDSVLHQQYPNKELIIIDGKSTDGTEEIIRAVSEKISFWVSEKDNGIYDAMNKGIAAATGNWLLFLGADDMLCDNILSQIFEHTDYAGCGMLYGKIKMLHSGKLAGGNATAGSLIRNNIPHQAIFYARETIKKFNGYDTRYKILADYELNSRLFEDHSIQKKFIDIPVALFNEKGISNRTIDHDFFSCRLEYLLHEKKLNRTDPRLDKYYFFTGVSMALQKKWQQGLKNIWMAVRSSDRKVYYTALTADFFLSFLIKKRAYTLAQAHHLK